MEEYKNVDHDSCEEGKDMTKAFKNNSATVYKVMGKLRQRGVPDDHCEELYKQILQSDEKRGQC